MECASLEVELGFTERADMQCRFEGAIKIPMDEVQNSRGFQE